MTEISTFSTKSDHEKSDRKVTEKWLKSEVILWSESENSNSWISWKPKNQNVKSII